jgi:hypothetical protein
MNQKAAEAQALHETENPIPPLPFILSTTCAKHPEISIDSIPGHVHADLRSSDGAAQVKQ